jgi:protein-S-isoprenylcysteine O-methyltransferase Ste14
MYWFVIPLFLGFTSNAASAFTTLYSEKWRKARGTILSIILRDITGIPVWAAGFVLAIRESSGFLYRISLITKLTAWLLILAGTVIIIIALINIKIKAAAASTEDRIVKKSIYSVIRHPVHSGTFLEFAGLFVLQPSLQTGLASVIGCMRIFVFLLKLPIKIFLILTIK